MERHEKNEMPVAIMCRRQYSGEELEGKHHSFIVLITKLWTTHGTTMTIVCSAMSKHSPSVSGKTRRTTDGSGGRPTQPRQQSAAWVEAEDNHCETYNHCANYCERRDGLITQEYRRRTASAPYVPLGNHMWNQKSKT